MHFEIVETSLLLGHLFDIDFGAEMLFHVLGVVDFVFGAEAVGG